MLIVNKKAFSKGMILLVTFLALFAVIISPIFKDDKGKNITGLEYADAMFNSLSKGSSYFIPAVRERVKSVEGKQVEVTIPVKNAERGKLMLLALDKAGATGTLDGDKLTYKGDLGAILEAAVADSDLMYANDGVAVSQKYDNASALGIMKAWWYMFSPSIKALQKQGKINEASVVDAVVRRAVEPGNNFYSVPPTRVADHMFLMAGLLIFYVIYTLWYGFAIFEIFDGVGLTMSKSKVKQEG